VIELPAALVQAIARGDAVSIALPNYPVRLVICATDEAIDQFRDAVMRALMHNLRPAEGVH